MKSSGSFSEAAFARTLSKELRAGRAVVLCSVLATRGSVPRHAGARMALLQSGAYVGTVGGGRIELLAQKDAEALMAARDACASGRCAAWSLSWVESQSVGMLCGGAALVALRMLGHGDLEVLEFLGQSDATARLNAVLCEDWSHSDGPSWWIEPSSSSAAQVTPGGPTWDEQSRIYREPLRSAARVFVFGGGHVAAALVPVLNKVGFEVAVIEQRAALATPQRFPDGVKVIACDYRDLGEYVDVTGDDFVVVMTHEHVLDVEVLVHVTVRAPYYIGCMGSARKAARVHEILVGRGLPQLLVDRIQMPVGVDIGAETPEEIAVSIAAELICARAHRQGS